MSSIYFKITVIYLLSQLVFTSCKQSQNDTSEVNNQSIQKNTLSGEKKTEVVTVKEMQPFPVVSHTSLLLTEIEADALPVKDFHILTVHLFGQESGPEYYHYKICHQSEPEKKCFKISLFSNVLFYPLLTPGNYQISGRACTRKALSEDEIECGEEVTTGYEFIFDNRNSASKDKIKEWTDLIAEISLIPAKIDEVLKEYKNDLEKNGIPEPSDDSERVINNILTLGPYKHARFFFSRQFLELQSSMAKQEGVSLRLTQEKDPRSYEYEDNTENQEKSTMGKILIVGGLASIFLGIVNMNNIIGNLKHDRQKDVVEYWKKEAGKKTPGATEKLSEAETKLRKLDNSTEFGKSRVRKSKILAGGFIGSGILIFSAGLGMDLTSDTDTVNLLRKNMMARLSAIEASSVPIITRFHRLSAELGLNLPDQD